MWPVTLNDYMTLSNDLKKVLAGANKKARIELVNADRVQVAIKQQKLKCDVINKQYKREVQAIIEIIKSMVENEKKRALELEAKLDELENFSAHRTMVKQKLEVLQQRRAIEMAKEADRINKEQLQAEKAAQKRREKVFYKLKFFFENLPIGKTHPQ